ncbi:MAG: hypothetical protein ICV66_07895, partial [Chitinophagaceae bacterium]|nr:hypothetical protein [Chitinophagaceae bacterium]
PLKLFVAKKPSRQIAVQPDDRAAILSLNAGKFQRYELNFGSSFLSQSSRFLNIPLQAKTVTIINAKGEKRTINLINSL